MPELPEVETTRRGLARYLCGSRIASVIVRDRRLRWPVPERIEQILAGRTIGAIERRGKYLLIDCGDGTLLVHLGMSGRLRLVPAGTHASRHDHIDVCLDNGQAMRLTDPRRFGAFLWLAGAAAEHPLLRDLGIEPLDDRFDGSWLYAATRSARVAIKQWLMNGRRVTGIGNIYANEALHRAGIHPLRAAGRLGAERCARLAAATRETLRLAIDAGGSSLRDYVDTDGQAGHFQQTYLVYGREGESCRNCGGTVRAIRQGQRATYYCPHCQR